MTDNKRLRKSFWFSFGYVGLSTMSLLGLYPDSLFSHDLWIIGLPITFPVSLPGFAVAYTEPNSQWLILAIQFVVFLLFWRWLYLDLRKDTNTSKG